ncbi:MAG: hypothetical protein ACREQZ_14390 [Woeseiaceae bacterium]
MIARRLPASVAALILQGIVRSAFAEDLPLFASEDTLDVLFEFPLRTIVREADDRPVVDGRLSYADADGRTVSIDLTMTTRGKSRLEYCRFPPLSMNLKRDRTDGTLFTGQNKLKIVSHCRSGPVFERYLLQEYGIYRALNVLTEQSFRVRRLNATYRDSEGRDKDAVSLAFFLESDNEVADRLGFEKFDVSIVNPAQLDEAHASLVALFQFMVANTDWSSIRGPEDEGCCHNGKVVVPPASRDGWLVIPYDFDQSGVINTSYSSPADQLGIRSVRQRLYRGRCSHLDRLEATRALFNERRAALETALLPEGVEDRFRASVLSYIDDFYAIINDDRKRERYLENACLGGD